MIVAPTPTNPRSPLRRALRVLGVAIPVALLVLVAVKLSLGYRIGLDNLPLTLAEGFAVGLTMYLAARVGRTTDLVHEGLVQLLMMSQGRAVPDFAEIEPLAQREISRARRFERPVTLVTLRMELHRPSGELAVVVERVLVVLGGS